MRTFTRADTSLRPWESTKSILLLPTTSRIAVSAACRTLSSGLRLLKRYSSGLFSVYWTANCTSTMFSSSVSISASCGCLFFVLPR